MPIKVRSLLHIESEHQKAIETTVIGMGFQVVYTEKFTANGKGGVDDDTIVCVKTFKEKNMMAIVTLPDFFKEIPGVMSVQVIPEDVEEMEDGKKPPIYKKPIIPLIVSAVITLLTLIYAVEHLITLLDPEHAIHIDPFQFVLIVGFPPIIVFLVQFLLKYFPDHHI